MIVIIGAGVCGLAAAYELARRGERAIVLERGKPFAEQVRRHHLARIPFAAPPWEAAVLDPKAGANGMPGQACIGLPVIPARDIRSE